MVPHCFDACSGFYCCCAWFCFHCQLRLALRCTRTAGSRRALH